MCASRLHIRRTCSVSLWTRVHLLAKTACSRLTFLSTAAHSTVSTLSSASASSIPFLPRVPLISTLHHRLPTDFSKPIHVDLPISHAGAFCYWVEYDGPTPGTRDKGREGYFNIDPILRTKARAPVLDASGLPTSGELAVVDKHVNLPLDGLSILTVVSKWMGPLPEWAKHFAEARDRGYTMLHYTPLQERGASDSPYSIRGQHVYDPDLFGGKRAAGGGVKEVEEVLRLAKEEYGLLSLTDVVLNHTASDSAWLDDHPEAGTSRPPTHMRRANSN